MANADFVTRILLENQQFRTQIAECRREIRDLRSDARSSSISIGGLRGSLIEMASKAVAPLAIAAAIKDIGIKSIEARSRIEQLEVSFSTLLRSQAQANALLQEIRRYGTVTPYDTEGLSKAAQTMLSFGISQERVMPTLRQLGDIAMGSQDKLSRLTLAFSQMSAAGRVTKEDLNQMIDAGFNPLQVISQQTGESIGTLFDKVSRGQVSVHQIANAFKDATKEGGQFHNMALNMSDTLTGKIAKMTDGWDNLKASIGGLASPAVLRAIEIATRTIDGLTEAIENLKKAAGDTTTGDGKYDSQTLNALKYAYDKGNKEGKTPKEKERIRKKTIQNGIDFEKKRLALLDKRISENARKQNEWRHPKKGKKPNPTLRGQRETLDYLVAEQSSLIHESKRTKGRVKVYEKSLKENPYESRVQPTSNYNNHNFTPTKTTGNRTTGNIPETIDPITQANKSYNDTMMELNGKLKDSMITQKEYDEKKKSALESLIDAYYKQGKTINNSHELADKVKKLGDVKFAIQHTDAINEANKEFADAINSATKQYVNNLSTDDEYDNAIIEAKKKMIQKFLEIGNLTTEEETTLKQLIADVKADQKSDMQKSLKEDVSDITKKDTSIADKFNFGNKHRDKQSNKEQLDDLVKQFDELTAKRKEKADEAKKLGISLDFSELDKQQAELSSKIANMAKEAKKEANFDNIFDGLNDIGDLASGIQSIGTAFDDVKNPLDAFIKGIGVITEMMQAYKTVTEIVTIAQDLFSASTTASATADTAATTAATAAESAKAAADTASIAPAMEATAAAKAQEAAYLDLAAAAYFAAHASIPFAGFGIAAGFISSMMAMMASQTAASAAIGAFATGGIIQGANTHGDQLLARVNAGEMILNGSQQRNLFNLLDGGTGSNMSGQVEFKISGSALKGVLRNYDNKMSVL